MIRFIVVSEDWQHLTTVIGKEAETNIKARFHFYADQKRKKSFKRWLFDPSYEIDSPRMREIFIELKQCQHQIGLHPSYDTWETSNPIAQQKKYLEKVLESGSVAPDNIGLGLVGEELGLRNKMLVWLKTLL